MTSDEIRSELLADCYGRLAVNIVRANKLSFNHATGSETEFDYTNGCDITATGTLIVSTNDGKRYHLTITLEETP